MGCLKKMFNGEIKFHLKSIATEKHLETSGIFIDMNTNILARGRNFKTFLRENCEIALFNMELNMF